MLLFSFSNLIDKIFFVKDRRNDKVIINSHIQRGSADSNSNHDVQPNNFDIFFY